MTGCTPTSILLPANSQFQPALPDEHSKVSSYPYLEVLGSLTYAAMGTRLDISYAVRSLAPFVSNFGHAHINGLKHIMQILQVAPSKGSFTPRAEEDLLVSPMLTGQVIRPINN